MKRMTFLAAAGGAFAMTAIPCAAWADDSAITLATPTGTIHGTLSLPASAPPYPVVLIIAGSGPTDRDGNAASIHPDSYKLLAAALARDGIASVRYDKRGVGESAQAAPPESQLRFLRADAEQLEHRRLHLFAVNTHRSATDLRPVQRDVVRLRQRGVRRGAQQCRIIGRR